MTSSCETGSAMARAALDLCGTGFRLHGRNPRTGLDCIGLISHCLLAGGVECPAPNGYAIRGGSERRINAHMKAAGFLRLDPDQPLCEGDIILARPSPVQWHFLIRAADGSVHAHAGLGKIVFHPGDPPWPVASIFRVKED